MCLISESRKITIWNIIPLSHLFQVIRKTIPDLCIQMPAQKTV